MTATIIDGSRVAEAIRGEVNQQVQELKREQGIVPGLAVVLVGDNPASAAYVRGKARACTEVGIDSITVRPPADVTQAELLKVVWDLNNDPRYHGILVQLPLPSHIDEAAVLEAISPDKDVDGLHSHNMGKLLKGEGELFPCTPAGVQQLLVRSGYSPEGKHVVICGRSNLVGKPLAALLVQKRRAANATVTICHTGTRDLPGITRQADILVAAMGSAGSITAEMVSPHTVVVDVGINRVADAASKTGYRLVGDVDFDVVREKVAAITPVPGGVGPMTIAMLLVNTVRAARSQATHGSHRP